MKRSSCFFFCINNLFINVVSYTPWKFGTQFHLKYKRMNAKSSLPLNRIKSKEEGINRYFNKRTSVLREQCKESSPQMVKKDACTKQATWHLKDINSEEWIPLSQLRDTLEPSTLCTNVPRLAKDKEYAEGVLQAWKREFKTSSKREEVLPEMSMGATLELKIPNDGTILHNYIVVPESLLLNENSNQDTIKAKLPGVLLFHTGAGPHDVFLRWKADSLVSSMNKNQRGCIVIIVDLLSDSTGWSWSSDRTKYNSARKELLMRNNKGVRVKLRQRICAALKLLQKLDEVDEKKIGALGWCLGGHSIFELGVMHFPGVCALSSFHGVFDGNCNVRDRKKDVTNKEYVTKTVDGMIDGSVTPIQGNEKERKEEQNKKTQVLICNGKDDPFVSSKDLDTCISVLRAIDGCTVKKMEFEGVKHGFTNPAQDSNPSLAFEYNEKAAIKSWHEATQLLLKVFE